MLEVLLSQAVLPWILIGIGIVLLIVEATSPGFFLGVPGTALLVLGVFSFVAYDLLFTTPFGLIAGIGGAIVAAVITIIIYRKISPDKKPSTLSKDTIIDKTGIVTSTITPDSLSGKVEIEGAIWSAKSTGDTISPGAKIRVTEAHGVHLIVVEVK